MLTARLAAIEKKYQQLLSDLLSEDDQPRTGVQDAPSLRTAFSELETQKKAVQTALDQLPAPTSGCSSTVLNDLSVPVSDIKNLPPEQLQTLLQAAISRVLVSSDTYRIILTGHSPVEMSRFAIQAEMPRQTLNPSIPYQFCVTCIISVIISCESPDNGHLSVTQHGNTIVKTADIVISLYPLKYSLPPKKH